MAPCACNSFQKEKRNEREDKGNMRFKRLGSAQRNIW